MLALATPSAAADEPWTLYGSGWGHGVGMSQYGAYQMALEGRTAPQILAHYYTGTTYNAVTDTGVISVNLVNNVASAAMTTTALSSGGGAVSVTGGAATMTGALGAKLTATAPSGGTGVTITCPTCTPTSVTGSRLTVAWDDDRTLLAVGGKSYRDGKVSVTRVGTTARVNVVAQVRVHDEYLDYIAEMPWSWHSEALRAQAAAARGYALAALAKGIRTDCDCHVFNTSASQVYGGYPSSANLPYWSRWTSAVRASGSASTGYVVRHNGAIIQALYHSSSGGRTQNNEDVWGGAALPYLRGVADSWSRTEKNPRRSWKVAQSPASLATAFGLKDVARLDLSKRYASIGVASATATSAAGVSATLTGEQLRTKLGLNSTYLQRAYSRLGGSNPYAVAVSVAARTPVGAKAVVIASGEPAAFIDTALAGPLASAVGGPLLLSTKTGLPTETTTELKRRAASAKTAYIVGSESVLSAKVVTQLKGLGLKVVRISGKHEYATARLVAAEIAKHVTVKNVVVIAPSGELEPGQCCWRGGRSEDADSAHAVDDGVREPDAQSECPQANACIHRRQRGDRQGRECCPDPRQDRHPAHRSDEIRDLGCGGPALRADDPRPGPGGHRLRTGCRPHHRRGRRLAQAAAGSGEADESARHLARDDPATAEGGHCHRGRVDGDRERHRRGRDAARLTTRDAARLTTLTAGEALSAGR